MILSKTHADAPDLVLRDLVATDAGYDNSPESDQPILVIPVNADRLAVWESEHRAPVRAAPEVALEVWSRE